MNVLLCSLGVFIATCFYPVRSKEEGENIVKMVMMVLEVIAPFNMLVAT